MPGLPRSFRMRGKVNNERWNNEERTGKNKKCVQERRNKDSGRPEFQKNKASDGAKSPPATVHPSLELVDGHGGATPLGKLLNQRLVAGPRPPRQPTPNAIRESHSFGDSSIFLVHVELQVLQRPCKVLQPPLRRIVSFSLSSCSPLVPGPARGASSGPSLGLSRMNLAHEVDNVRSPRRSIAPEDRPSNQLSVIPTLATWLLTCRVDVGVGKFLEQGGGESLGV